MFSYDDSFGIPRDVVIVPADANSLFHLNNEELGKVVLAMIQEIDNPFDGDASLKHLAIAYDDFKDAEGSFSEWISGEMSQKEHAETRYSELFEKYVDLMEKEKTNGGN